MPPAYGAGWRPVKRCGQSGAPTRNANALARRPRTERAAAPQGPAEPAGDARQIDQTRHGIVVHQCVAPLAQRDEAPGLLRDLAQRRAFVAWQREVLLHPEQVEPPVA